MAAALFFLATVGAFWRVLHRTTWGTLLVSSLALGGAVRGKVLRAAGGADVVGTRWRATFFRSRDDRRVGDTDVAARFTPGTLGRAGGDSCRTRGGSVGRDLDVLRFPLRDVPSVSRHRRRRSHRESLGPTTRSAARHDRPLGTHRARLSSAARGLSLWSGATFIVSHRIGRPSGTAITAASVGQPFFRIAR